jgi:hypothetical protein
MKKFLAVYLGSPGGEAAKRWNALDEKARAQREQEGMAAWGKWLKDNAAALVDIGAPVGNTKHVSQSGISDVKNNIAAYVIVQAESLEAAAKLFVNHPHFSIFPGDSVEVMPCLPIPGM